VHESIPFLPVLVEEIAVSEIRDAGAADRAETSEGPGIGRLPDQAMQSVAGALERRAMVRRAEEDERS
jgi:hypothetical protein